MKKTKKTEVQKPNPVGRPRKPITEKQVLELAKIGCTNIEIATVLGCCDDTLVNNFSEALKKGREEMKKSLRRFQYLSAQKGNVTMQIWLGKQYLGQRDKVDVDVKDARERAEEAVAEYLKRKPEASREDAILALQNFIPQISELVN